LWDLKARKRLREVGKGDAWVTAAAIRPDGKRAITGDAEGRLRLWDLEAGAEVLPESGPAPLQPLCVAHAPGLGLAVSGHVDGALLVWDVAAGKVLRKFTANRSDNVLCVAIAPDGRRVACGHHSGALRVRDLRDPEKEEVVWQHAFTEGRCQAVAFSKDGKQLYCGLKDVGAAGKWKPEFGAIRVFDAGSGKRLGMLKGHTRSVSALAVSPDGARLASSSGDGNRQDQTVRLWDLATGKELARMEKHTQTVHGVAFSTDGKRVASVGEDGRLILWEPASDATTVVDLGEPGRAVAFDGEGKGAVAATAYGRVVAVNLVGKVTGELRLPGAVSALVAVDRKHLLTANANGTCYVLRLPLRARR
jgi:WD40 repeat protein